MIRIKKFTQKILLNYFIKFSCCALVLMLANCKEEVSEPLILGQTYQGGIIIFLDDNAQHGLIATTTDQHTTVQWCLGSCQSTNASGTAPGSGKVNTAKIVALQTNGNYAASICDQLVHNGYDDWFLPSKDELHFLFVQKESGRIFNFLAKEYWSSTESTAGRAWIEHMGNGDMSEGIKENTACVRAMRSF